MTAKPITPEAARDLAVRYNAYHEALSAGDSRGIRVWGGMLIESIEETGVDLDARSIARVVETHTPRAGEPSATPLFALRACADALGALERVTPSPFPGASGLIASAALAEARAVLREYAPDHVRRALQDSTP